MKKLFLFDNDGTLVTGHDISVFRLAIKRVLGLDVRADKDFRGMTDYLVLQALLKDIGWQDADITMAMPGLIRGLNEAHAETFQSSDLKLIPGALPLLDALAQKDAAIGLITGNLEQIAQRKLSALGVWDYFSVGGFGSDPHQTRGDLVELAIKRAGFEDSMGAVYVIGDTVLDIAAAHEAGVTHSVGVANGFRPEQELIDAGAEIVLKDFLDTVDVLKQFEIA